ncbi:MAG: hypothetical protein ACFE0P_10455 [Oceanicaulis sp.]
MILDNLSRALKTQNWLAAGIEFVIVIAGVVIGFQINAWNEARQAATREASVLERLREGLIADQAERAASANNLNRLENLRAAVAVLFENAPIENSNSFCGAVVTSDFFSDASSPPTALAELLSGDEGLSLISNPQLRSGIADYVQFRQTLPRSVDWYTRGSVNLDQAFPQHFRQIARIDPNSGRIQAAYICDVQGMREDAQFLSAFAENAWRYEYYFTDVVEDHATRVAQLIEQLDQVLNEETTP